MTQKPKIIDVVKDTLYKPAKESFFYRLAVSISRHEENPYDYLQEMARCDALEEDNQPIKDHFFRSSKFFEGLEIVSDNTDKRFVLRNNLLKISKALTQRNNETCQFLAQKIEESANQIQAPVIDNYYESKKDVIPNRLNNSRVIKNPSLKIDT